MDKTENTSKNRIIIDDGNNVAENLKKGFDLAFNKAFQENKSISLIAITKNILKKNLNTIYGENFLKEIELTGTITIQKKMFNINIMTEKTVSKILPYNIALYVYPTKQLLQLMEEKEHITDEIVIKYQDKDIEDYKAKWNL